jgi:hypothetical protein
VVIENDPGRYGLKSSSAARMKRSSNENSPWWVAELVGGRQLGYQAYVFACRQEMTVGAAVLVLHRIDWPFQHARSDIAGVAALSASRGLPLGLQMRSLGG